MLRRVPLKRSGFARKAPPRRSEPEEAPTYHPRPSAPPRGSYGPSRVALVLVPKDANVRDDRLRDMCRAMACQHCGAAGDGAGVTWAHSNQAAHGKGLGMKASDVFVAALCWTCHSRLDQGSDWTQAQRLEVWSAAHRRTVALGVQSGAWPADLPVPPSIVTAR